MGLKGADFIAVGSESQIYALVEGTVNKYIDDQWVKLPGPKVQKIAVGRNGTLYVINENQSILKSTQFDEEYESGHRKCVNDTLYNLCKKAFSLATEGKI